MKKEIFLGYNYLNEVILDNQELFGESLDYCGSSLNNLKALNDCMWLARKKFVNEIVIRDFVCKCTTDAIYNDFLLKESEKVFFESINEVYRRVLIGNVQNMMINSSINDVVADLHKAVINLKGGTVIGYIGTLNLQHIVNKEETKEAKSYG